MEKSIVSYHFKYVSNCIMCGAPTEKHKILGKRLNRSQGGNPKNRVGITTTIIQCSNCSLIYSNPQPIPLSIQDHYGILPEVYWKDTYFMPDANYFSTEIEKAKLLITFKQGMKSLDIGAGLGKAMIALSRSGFDAYGFEPSE